jgi:hypothetical protein
MYTSESISYYRDITTLYLPKLTSKDGKDVYVLRDERLIIVYPDHSWKYIEGLYYDRGYSYDGDMTTDSNVLDKNNLNYGRRLYVYDDLGNKRYLYDKYMRQLANFGKFALKSPISSGTEYSDISYIQGLL